MSTFLVLLVAYVLSQFFRAFLAVVASDIGRDLGLDTAQLASLPAVFLAAFALAQFPVGYSLDRFGPKRTLAAFMTAWIAGTVVLGSAQNHRDALLALALLGVGCAPVMMAGFYLASRLYSVRHFATMSSILIGVGSIGDPLSGAPLAWILARCGWRAAMFGLTGVAAFSVGLVLLLLRDPPAAEGDHPPAAFLDGFGAIMATRALWPIFPITAVSYAVTIVIRGLWIVPYLEEVHGLGQTEASFAAMMMGFAMAAGALAYVPLTSRLGGPKRAVVSGVSICMLACLALGITGGRGAGLAIGLLLVLGLTGMSYAILMAHARAFMSVSGIGRGITFMNFLFMGGAGALQWLSGLFVNRAQLSGLPAAETFGRLFVGFAILLGAALVVYCFAPAPSHEAEPA